MDISKIRNFSIIAHIDHGKSTLADRMLEVTATVSSREMKDQVLDSMELERERGITIKMTPVRMQYSFKGTEYILNLIDTPGHIDFSYEVGRALKAVEGSLLLVDSTQGVQAQTLTTLGMAREQGLTIIPVITKIDSPLARIDAVAEEIVTLLDCDLDSILKVSGKTGEGVEEVLQKIIATVPPPTKKEQADLQALVFDFNYSNHRGITLYTRVFESSIKKGDELFLFGAKEKFAALEVGVFTPKETPKDSITSGEIGYVVTGLKKPGIASVGDTVMLFRNQTDPLPGYMNPKPVVFCSIYPEDADDFDFLRQALERLRLSDASITFEEESSSILGRGFRAGFLGMLHLEIITERLHREFSLELVITTPSISYRVKTKKDTEPQIIYSPTLFPPHGDIEEIYEQWISARVITPSDYVSAIMQILYDFEAEFIHSESFGDGRVAIDILMPLRELMRNFFDVLKSVSSGFASLSYEMAGEQKADVVRMDVFVADEMVPAFTRIVSRKRMEEEAKKMTEKLYENLPRQLFVTKIQAQALGKIISSKTLSALRKDVTGYLYGGDITRKMKLLEKQKKGKKKMKARGKVNIPQDVFMKMMKG